MLPLRVTRLALPVASREEIEPSYLVAAKGGNDQLVQMIPMPPQVPQEVEFAARPIPSWIQIRKFPAEFALRLVQIYYIHSILHEFDTLQEENHLSRIESACQAHAGADFTPFLFRRPFTPRVAAVQLTPLSVCSVPTLLAATICSVVGYIPATP